LDVGVELLKQSLSRKEVNTMRIRRRPDLLANHMLAGKVYAPYVMGRANIGWCLSRRIRRQTGVWAINW